MSQSYNELLNELSSIIKEKNAKLHKIENLYNGLKQENMRLSEKNKTLKSKNDILIKENVLLSKTVLNQLDTINKYSTDQL